MHHEKEHGHGLERERPFFEGVGFGIRGFLQTGPAQYTSRLAGVSSDTSLLVHIYFALA